MRKVYNNYSLSITGKNVELNLTLLGREIRDYERGIKFVEGLKIQVINECVNVKSDNLVEIQTLNWRMGKNGTHAG